MAIMHVSDTIRDMGNAHPVSYFLYEAPAITSNVSHCLQIHQHSSGHIQMAVTYALLRMGTVRSSSTPLT